MLHYPFTNPLETLSGFSKKFEKLAEELEPESTQAFIARELARDTEDYRSKLSEGAITAEDIVQQFFKYYFTNQVDIAGTPIGHNACIVGHDFGVDAGLPPETLEQYWQSAEHQTATSL